MSKDKQLASITMLEAYAKAYRAYFLDYTNANLKAMRACQTAVSKMLEPYYMEEGKANVKDDD